MFWDALRFSVPSDSLAQGKYVKSLGPVSEGVDKFETWRSDVLQQLQREQSHQIMIT